MKYALRLATLGLVSAVLAGCADDQAKPKSMELPEG